MYNKDYLLRQLTTLMEAISNIVNAIDKEDMEGAKIQISDSYNLFGITENYFKTNSTNVILKTFKEQEGNYLERVKILTQLLYYEALMQGDTQIKKDFLEKATTLLAHYLQNSKEYSFALISLQNEMKKTLANLS